MYRSLYLLSVPEDKTVIRSGRSSLLSRGDNQNLPPQEHPAGDNYEPEPFQLDPNDDDMSRLQETPATYEYREETQERTRSIVPIDYEGYLMERDRMDYLQQERESERRFERSDYPFHDFNYGP